MSEGWIGTVKALGRTLRREMQGKQKAKKRKECSEFAAKQMDKFKKGKPTDILQHILRRRMPINMLHRWKIAVAS